MMTLAYRRYAEFAGRSTRTEYWLYQLTYFIIYVVLSMVGALIGGKTGSNLLGSLFALASLVPGFCVSARRLHDTNRSAWNMMWLFLPIAGAIVYLVYMVLPSDPYSNNFGAPYDDGATGGYSDNQVSELEQLARMRDSGALTQEESRPGVQPCSDGRTRQNASGVVTSYGS